ncbi:helicase C-terminal domain-containing protein [Microbulbifer sp. 2304DJ12-6]|uniref:helicase C-terminal domain-containing protein n=1 Tax=Microbulbifer sp. 2304DJ12-6 TaxID=3233340 RepID=UPI0039AF76A3
MTWEFNDKTELNRALLKELRLRLVDKAAPIIDWPGKRYEDKHPADESLMGSIGQMPNPDFTGFQAPNSMGVVLLATPGGDGHLRLVLNGNFDIFHRSIPTFKHMMGQIIREEDNSIRDTQTLPISFRRFTVQFSDLVIDIPLPSRVNQWCKPDDDNSLSRAMSALEADLLNEPDIFKRSKTRENGQPEMYFPWDEDRIIDQDSLNATVIRELFDGENEVLPYRPSIRTRARIAPPSLSETGNQYLVEIFLENNTLLDDARMFGVMKNAHFLDVQFDVQLDSGKSHGLPHRLEPADYRLHDRSTVPGYGVTTSVNQIGKDHFATDAMPISELEKIDNPEPEDLGMKDSPSFENLSKEPVPILRELISAVNDYANDWQQKIDGLLNEGKVREAEVSTIERNSLLQECDNMEDGIDLLEKHPHLLQCFIWMNEAMRNAFIQQNKPFVNTWRLFQLGFILTQIRSIYERCCDRSELTDHLDTAEVLWFSTGGGKTEAYLGIIVMGLLYERMKGRTYGTTAWMKFPLRMLSVQQFQRLSYVVAQANRIRERESDKLPGHPFTIGYFTGEGTPRNITSSYDSDTKTFLPTLTANQLKQWRFIKDCPYCDQENSVDVVSDLSNGRIKHVCRNAQCWSNTEASPGEHGEGIHGELGIIVSDEEVYRYIPSVMVGTIDKLATIAHNTRYRYFFGGGRYYCPQHGFSFEGRCVHRAIIQGDDGNYTSEQCRNSTRGQEPRTIPLSPMTYPGISFVIQDELHLLAENTGNFDAHYETLMSSLQEANDGRRPKVLSATATIKGYEHHIHHLYQRKARRFPVPGVEQGESFYSRIHKENGKPLVRRLYAGIYPLGTGTVMERTSAIVSMRYLEMVDYYRKALQDSPNDTAYSLGFTPAQSGDIADHLDRYMNACLIYINSIRGTSNVNRHMEEEQSSRHPDWRWRQLDGKTSLDEIQDAISLIESKSSDDPTRQLIATSVVSHGVDMSRLNFMVVGGWPKSIAEYMQSSARAGREQPGIVLSVMNSKNLFQSNVFLNFQDYHLFMDRMVESVPVNRFAPNLLERTLPGIIAACLNNWAASQPWGESIRKSGGKLKEALNDSTLAVRQALKSQIMNALSVPEVLIHEGSFDQRVVNDFQTQLERTVDLALNRLEGMPNTLSDLYIPEVIERLMGNRPMFSLRDIESQINVKPWTEEGGRLLEALARNE